MTEDNLPPIADMADEPRDDADVLADEFSKFVTISGTPPPGSSRYEAIAKLAGPRALDIGHLLQPLPRETSPRLVSFDLETTGTTAESRIVQFGAVTVDPVTLMPIGQPAFLYVHPGLPISYEAAKINKITEEDLKGQPDFAHRADDISAVLEGALWIGFNIVKYDIPLLRREYARVNRAMPSCAGVLDVYALAAAWRVEESTGNLKLDTLSRWLGLGDEKHDALDDAQRTLNVLKTMMAARCIAAVAATPLFPASDPRPRHFAVPHPDPAPITPSLEEPPSSSNIGVKVIHVDKLEDMKRSREKCSEDVATWPEDAKVGSEWTRLVFRLAARAKDDPPTLFRRWKPSSERMRVVDVAVYGCYKKSDGSVFTCLLRPEVLKVTQAEVVDLLGPAPRKPGDALKTFRFDRFLWIQLAVIVST